MKGYAYADLDGNLVYKVADYIDNINPGFFGQNRHMICKHWSFDTDDVSSMIRMFKNMDDLKLRVTTTQSFIKTIGYDMTRLRQNANPV